MRVRMLSRLVAVMLGIIPVSGCALFSGAEFYLSGSSVAVMPFKGPDDKWYGEHKTADLLCTQARHILRQGGATVRQSDKIELEVTTHAGDSDPPWIAYGEQMGVQYVVVAHLALWEIEGKSTVNYVTGSAILNVDVYDVVNQDLTFSRAIEVVIGTGDSAEDMYSDVETGKKALIRLLLREWRRIFIGAN